MQQAGSNAPSYISSLRGVAAGEGSALGQSYVTDSINHGTEKFVTGDSSQEAMPTGPCNRGSARPSDFCGQVSPHSHLPDLTQGATRQNIPLELFAHLPFSWLSPFQRFHRGLALALRKMHPVFTQTCHWTLPPLIGTWEMEASEGHREKYEVCRYGGSFGAL